jgi:GTP cyclohydrolase II
MGSTERSRSADHGIQSLSSAARRVAQALDALRHGWPIALDGAFTLLPAETGLGAAQARTMLISCARAVTLKLANQREAAVPEAPVLIRAADPFDLAAARALADPALDLTWPLKGPFLAEPLLHEDAARAAMELARLAGILPAFLVDPDPCGGAVPVSASDLAAWKDTAQLAIAARARLPVEACNTAEIVAFRSADDLREHVALVIGAQTGDRAPLVRLHSECLTGDILGSLKCDCGPQLDAALARMAEEASGGGPNGAGPNEAGWGLLLYLRQEGRGIGLINKLRAYALQDQGFDTVDANTRLGFEPDERDFTLAAAMLTQLGVGTVSLLTNNPLKVAGLAAHGLAVTRVAHHMAPNPHNSGYLDTKRDRQGHLL